eukprot:CAMPEP_0171048702 /NCGR_PEP_ID=MMETSP0736-20130129/51176_1 /TAXON_ID=186038 /ORGANISM="Fragilariopsis kerguelensis, Strain L26-C5" /LENGTH=156 /DNA_ID=CAMNT_0011500761 /DNA_START=223 /DNA_END=693 /DNA_ORIENTATION=-
MTKQQEMTNPSSSSSSSASLSLSLSSFIEIPKESTSILNVNNQPSSTATQSQMVMSSNEVSTQEGFVNYDMKYFESALFCHFEEKQCPQQQQYVNSCCYCDEEELELDIQFKFTPTLTFEINNRVQQETFALLNELKQEQYDGFSIPKMIFDTSDM